MRTTMSMTIHDVTHDVVPENHDSTPSFQNPTREYLSNCMKTDLQKYCREIGIARVWTTKAELIDLIMARNSSSQSPTSPEDNTPIPNLYDIAKSLRELRERENTKDQQIEELQEHLKAAHVTINKLNDRLSTLEEQVNVLQCSHVTAAGGSQLSPSDTSTTPSSQQPSEGTLLLGDDNLWQAHTSDLDEKCSIRTIRGANVDLVRCWINEKLSWTPRSCILYCGYQDIREGNRTEDIFDGFGSLIACLKQRNENIDINICELAPAVGDHMLDERINNFNIKLADWCQQNGVSIINTNLQFRLGTSEVDQMCFQTNNDNANYLNRYGIIRLLSIISSQCPSFNLHKNWNDIITHASSDLLQRSNAKHRIINSRNTEKHQGNKRQYSPNPMGYRQNTRHIPYTNGDQPHPPTRSRPRANRRPSVNGDTHLHRQAYQPHHAYQPHQAYQPRQTSQRRRENNGQTYRLNHHFRNSGQAYQDRQQPCHNCGEVNHSHLNCRHQFRFKCMKCNGFGHKTRLCPNNI